MTVETSTSRSGPYAGAGTVGPFPVTYRFLDNSHLLVVQTNGGVETTLVLAVDYTVAGAGADSGGTVTLTAALPVGQTLTIIRNVPITQLTDYVQSDSFPAQSHEDGLDKLTMIALQQQESISGAIRVPEVTSTLPPLPAAAARALTSLVFDSLGNPAVAAALPSGNFQFGIRYIDQFTSTGGTTYTLSANPGLLKNIDVWVAGLKKRNGIDYTWSSGLVLTSLGTPYPNGSAVEIQYTQALPIGIADASVVTFSPSATAPAGSVSAALAQRIPVLDSVAALRTYSSSSSARVLLTGYYAAHDGAGGVYLYDPTDSSSSDNGGTVIVATDNSRWKLQFFAEVSLVQFGVKGTGNTADAATNATRLQAAVTWAADPTLTFTSRRLYAPTGHYYVGAGIVKASSLNGLNIRGDGLLSTKIEFTTSAGLSIVGGSGNLVNSEISDIWWTGTGSTVLVELAGQDGQRLRRCRFDTSAEGLRFHNRDAGSFTEYSTAEECSWSPTCALSVRYMRTSGTDSFHGSGLKSQCTINASAGGVGVQIDAGCRPYNAPMFVHIWNGASPYTLINNSNTTLPVDFYGQLTVETGVNVTLGVATAGNEISFVGGVTSNNEHVLFGQLFLCSAMTLGSDGSINMIGGRFSKKQAMTTGGNTITGAPVRLVSGHVSWAVTVVGTNYTYKARIETGGYDASGLLTITPTALTLNNTAGYGAPTFTLSTMSQLIITNGSFPSSGLTAYVDATQVGQVASAFFLGA